MQLCRIDGNVVSTVCHPSLHGFRLLICQPLDCEGRDEGAPVVAVDCQGAGHHQRVLITGDGVATRACVKDDTSPLRFMVVAVLDEEGSGEVTS